MSSSKIRHFLNNICSYPDTCYFEIGSWQGSTLVAALYRNENSITDAVGIDNWSEFGGPKQAFIANVQSFIPRAPLRFFEMDCFTMNNASTFARPINVYLYDGCHSVEAQEQAFTYFNDIFDDVFIALVDDWNWSYVQQGTFAAFEKLRYKILFQKAFLTDRNGNGDPYTWWNGFYIAVIQKN